MTRALLILASVLWLQACGQNPLLRTVSANFAPVRLGSQWTYSSPTGGTGLNREVTAEAVIQGRNTFTITSQAGALPATSALWTLNDGILETYSNSLGWTLSRRLPYVPGNKWNLETGNALVTAVQTVEALENIDVPAGKFHGCYRLKTKTSTYDAGLDVTSTAESLLWAAPDIGDVRYATVDAVGTVTITLELSSYRIPR